MKMGIRKRDNETPNANAKMETNVMNMKFEGASASFIKLTYLFYLFGFVYLVYVAPTPEKHILLSKMFFITDLLGVRYAP